MSSASLHQKRCGGAVQVVCGVPQYPRTHLRLLTLQCGSTVIDPCSGGVTPHPQPLRDLQQRATTRAESGSSPTRRQPDHDPNINHRHLLVASPTVALPARLLTYPLGWDIGPVIHGSAPRLPSPRCAFAPADVTRSSRTSIESSIPTTPASRPSSNSTFILSPTLFVPDATH